MDLCLAALTWDRWEIVGFVGETLFFARLLAQWTMSEYARKPVLPIAYWYLSLGGALILVFYAWAIGRPAVLLPNLIGLGLYARNLQLELAFRRRERERAAAGFLRPDFPWPRVSIVVPVHNEEKTLAATLGALLAQDYPAGRFEVIPALNGCTDGSRAVAAALPVKIAESERSGISFGRNLGARAADGEILIFIDADTTLFPDGVRRIVEAMHGHPSAVAVCPGRPERGGGVVRASFLIANWSTRRRRLSPPSSVTALHRSLFEAIGGFDENLPQGTNTDLVLRAQAAGGTFLFVSDAPATTSIRRFEKFGVVRQMLSWSRNHQELLKGEKGKVEAKPYEVIR